MSDGDLKCSTCSKLGDCNGTIAKCANCYEVEGRLASYLRSEKGRAFVDAARAVAFQAVMAAKYPMRNNCNKCGGCGSVSVPGELHDVACPQCGGHGSDKLLDHEEP